MKAHMEFHLLRSRLYRGLKLIAFYIASQFSIYWTLVAKQAANFNLLLWISLLITDGKKDALKIPSNIEDRAAKNNPKKLFKKY
jgi:uncharacterized membrane protein